MLTEDDVRRIALSLPEAEERETWGETTFRVRDKIFAMMAHGGDAVSVKTSIAEQSELLTLDPASFKPAAYTGRFGWVSVNLATVDPGLMEQVITGAWRRTAPKRLAATHDGRG
jgi:hypothetical protein